MAKEKEIMTRLGSHTSVLEEEELAPLHVLPAVPYEYAHWKRATVQINYQITLDYQNYSVPYNYYLGSSAIMIRQQNQLRPWQALPSK